MLGGRPLPSTNSMLAARLWLLSWHNRQALLFLHLLSLTMIRLLTPLQLQTTVATKRRYLGGTWWSHHILNKFIAMRALLPARLA